MQEILVIESAILGWLLADKLIQWYNEDHEEERWKEKIELQIKELQDKIKLK
jgi:hypothetical protein